MPHLNERAENVQNILSYQAGAKEQDHRGSSQMYWRTRGCRWVGWRWLLKGAVESRRGKSTLWIHIYFDYSFTSFNSCLQYSGAQYLYMWFGSVQAFMAQRSHLPDKILFVSQFYLLFWPHCTGSLHFTILCFSVFKSSLSSYIYTPSRSEQLMCWGQLLWDSLPL